MNRTDQKVIDMNLVLLIAIASVCLALAAILTLNQAGGLEAAPEIVQILINDISHHSTEIS